MTQPSNLHERQPHCHQPLGDYVHMWHVWWKFWVGKSVRYGQSWHFVISQRVPTGRASHESSNRFKMARLQQYSLAIGCDGFQIVLEPNSFANVANCSELVLGELLAKFLVGLFAVWFATCCGRCTHSYNWLTSQLTLLKSWQLKKLTLIYGYRNLRRLALCSIQSGNVSCNVQQSQPL